MRPLHTQNAEPVTCAEELFLTTEVVAAFAPHARKRAFDGRPTQGIRFRALCDDSQTAAAVEARKEVQVLRTVPFVRGSWS